MSKGRRGNWFSGVSVRSDPGRVYAAYLTAVTGGGINPMVEAILPYALNQVGSMYPDLSDDVRDDIMGEMASYLMVYVPKLVEMKFTSGSAILSYTYRRFRGECTRFVSDAEVKTEDFDIRQIPFMYMPIPPDNAMEEEEREEYKRKYAINNIRLSDIRKRHALVMINEDREALIGVTTPDTIKFIADYLAVLARIADREYMQACGLK